MKFVDYSCPSPFFSPIDHDMTGRHLFKHSTVRLAGFIALTGGLVACSTHERAGGLAGQDPVNKQSAKKNPAAEVRNEGVRKGWVRLDAATENYAEQVAAIVKNKWDEYRAMSPDVLSRGLLVTVLFINKRGKVEDIQIVNDEWSYPALTKLTLRAINNAKIPPVPAKVFSSLLKQNHGRLKMEYNALWMGVTPQQ